MKCQYCDGTGIEPCGNCDERDCGLDPDGRRPCFIDGEEYGAGPCRQGCPIPGQDLAAAGRRMVDDIRAESPVAPMSINWAHSGANPDARLASSTDPAETVDRIASQIADRLPKG